MNDSYNVEIEILTPVHIWDWNNISWIDYFCYQEELKAPYNQTYDWKDIKHKSYLYKYKIIDFKNILDEKDKKELESLFLLWNDTFEIRNFIYKKLELEKNKYRNNFLDISKEKIEIKNSFYNNWKDKILWKPKQSYWKTQEKKEAEFTNQLSQLEIKSFIKSIWRVYIPWSSIKWAIRTVLTNKEIENTSTEKDPFKKLIVRDSEFTEKWVEIWKLVRQSNNWDWIYAEFLKIWDKLNTEILIKDFLDESKLNKIDISRDIIISKSNEYLKNKINKYINEINELLKHPDINIKDTRWRLDSKSEKKQIKLNSVNDSFNKILSNLNNLDKNQCILNIWFWWWFWFKSFEWNEKHPKYCSIHNEWNHKKDNLWQHNSIAWMDVKHLISDEMIARTNWNIDLDNLWFIKLTF